MTDKLWRGVGSITGLAYGTPEYGKAWRELHKDRLAAERKQKYLDRKYRTARRYYWINKYKVLKGCENCGYNAHGVALDFDHIDRSEKKFTIARRVDLSTIKTLFKEIRKCRILCANCHRIKTLEAKDFERLPRTT